ncbi:MAG TPA: hypothetical protein VG455_08660, partial [Acidimicrobiales bacterium]|nr:hypothetical protein [Acidimicrobiales bacterium]
LTIGIPSFFLAFGRRAPRARPGFVRPVLRFAVPAGICAAVATFLAYAFGRLAPDVNLDEARTTATIVLLAVGLNFLLRLARPLTVWRRLLVGALALSYVASLTVPPLTEFFALNMPPPIVVLAALGAASIALWALDTALESEEAWLRAHGHRPWQAPVSRRRAPSVDESDS